MGFSIIPYSIENLEELFSDKTNTSRGLIKKKLHIIYFESYFAKLEAKTILIEEDYIDRDYLEDFSYYYVKSFKSYKRFCVRLHFFTLEISDGDFNGFLGGIDNCLSLKSLQDNYLGFVVLKPLPQTFIGRTCLKTYPSENIRYYPFIRAYDVNLFGIRLSVNSIAFQEQDSIVAACASSAIWSAFQATGMLFQHSIPSPVEITKGALKYFPYANRHFPNKGLTAEQMAHAIRNVGLEPFLINASEKANVKAIIYAYLKAKIPLVLGLNLINVNLDANGYVFGKHAVTITGFLMGDDLEKYNNDEFYLTSSRIRKVYAHDDQVGPFARMEFNEINNRLSTSWTDQNGLMGNVVAEPEILIIPIYRKIRIPYNVILSIISDLNILIRLIDEKLNIGFSNIEWDIFLSNSNDFKTEIFESDKLDEKQKIEILNTPFPKYVWRAVAIYGSDKFELLFDSTDLEQGDIFLKSISYSGELPNLLKVLAIYIPLDFIPSFQVRQILSEIKK